MSKCFWVHMVSLTLNTVATGLENPMQCFFDRHSGRNIVSKFSVYLTQKTHSGRKILEDYMWMFGDNQKLLQAPWMT